MILSDTTLKSLLSSNDLIVEPLCENAIQPASIDCRIGTHFLMMDPVKNQIITMDTPLAYKEIETEAITLQPHTFILATTMEYIKLPNNLTAFVEGRSSVGRMGLFIENAGWVDAGFEGKITLELYNATNFPIKIESGRRICQLVFCKMDQPAENPYRGKYQGQEKSVGSRVFQDNDMTKNTL